MFGAIISATDPVAVVAILKTLGVSKSLGTIIEGESLFNDGTAMVIFAVAVSAVEGETLTVGYVAGKFARLSFGGPILGGIMYLILRTWLSFVHFNPVLEVNLTICFAFITFFVAEHPAIHVSGILAIVILGILMTRSGKTTISNRSEHAVHTVWALVGFYAETMIFMLAGMFFGMEMTAELFKDNFWKSIVLYLFLIVIRLCLLMITKPILGLTGYPIEYSHVLLMTWGALRGALGLFLAMIVKTNPKINQQTKDVVMFHAAMIALFTLLINGTTTGKLVAFLGLSKQSKTAKVFSKLYMQKVDDYQLAELEVYRNCGYKGLYIP